jgi:hypothetical protein
LVKVRLSLDDRPPQNGEGYRQRADAKAYLVKAHYASIFLETTSKNEFEDIAKCSPNTWIDDLFGVIGLFFGLTHN